MESLLGSRHHKIMTNDNETPARPHPQMKSLWRRNKFLISSGLMDNSGESLGTHNLWPNYHYIDYLLYIGYNDNFIALGVSPSKSHTNIIGYSDNLCIDYIRKLDL